MSVFLIPHTKSTVINLHKVQSHFFHIELDQGKPCHLAHWILNHKDKVPIVVQEKLEHSKQCAQLVVTLSSQRSFAIVACFH